MDITSLDSLRSKRSNKLVNIVKKLKSKRKPTPTGLPDFTEPMPIKLLEETETKTEYKPLPEFAPPEQYEKMKMYMPEIKDVGDNVDLKVDSIRKTNYAPPGYLVWNHYYDNPKQKLPNNCKKNLSYPPWGGLL